jgi:hypothetical protein
MNSVWVLIPVSYPQYSQLEFAIAVLILQEAGA